MREPHLAGRGGTEGRDHGPGQGPRRVERQGIRAHQHVAAGEERREHAQPVIRPQVEQVPAGGGGQSGVGGRLFGSSEEDEGHPPASSHLPGQREGRLFRDALGRPAGSGARVDADAQGQVRDAEPLGEVVGLGGVLLREPEHRLGGLGGIGEVQRL